MEVPATVRLEMPAGLIGLRHLTQFELTPIAGSWPFFRLRSVGDEEFHFLVLAPKDLIAGYELEVSDLDTSALQLQSAADALVLNIVTVHSLSPRHLTVNLAGPVVVNRRSLRARQVIIENSDQFSTMHALVDERRAAHAA